MIYDRYENIERYYSKGSALYRAVEYIVDFDQSQPDGTYKIEGDDMFAIVKEYETFKSKEKKYETHRKYIDVQSLFFGKEAMHISLEKDLPIDVPYSDSTDKVRPKAMKDFSNVLLTSGYFVALFPNDFHRVDCIWKEKMKVRKICIKVSVDLM